MSKPVLTLGLIVSLVIMTMITVNSVSGSADKNNATLTVLINRGKHLIDNALIALRNDSNEVIGVKYLEFPYNSTRDEIIRLFSNRTPVDVVMVLKLDGGGRQHPLLIFFLLTLPLPILEYHQQAAYMTHTLLNVLVVCWLIQCG